MNAWNIGWNAYKQMCFFFHLNKWIQRRISHFPTLILEITGVCLFVWMHWEEEHNFPMSSFHRWNYSRCWNVSVASSWLTCTAVRGRTTSFEAVIWRAWTCAAAAGQSLSDTASEPSRWGCSPVVRSKACGPHQPALDSLTDRRGRPRLEPRGEKHTHLH